jgi:hypothetical protein
MEISLLTMSAMTEAITVTEEMPGEHSTRARMGVTTTFDTTAHAIAGEVTRKEEQTSCRNSMEVLETTTAETATAITM